MRTVGFVALTLVSLISSAGIASAQTVDRPAPAVAEFRNSCAACHGAEGKATARWRSCSLSNRPT
jgi:cytochrome c553